MPTVLLAGGTGFIGTRLSELLRAQGYQVRVLTRSPKAPDEFAWNPAAQTLDTAALAGVDAVVNLAGAGIAEKRWTVLRKQILTESRVKSAALLATAIGNMENPPKVCVTLCAIGYYGNTEEMLCTESAPAGSGFLSECCIAWENAAQAISHPAGLRKVILRVGIVLGKEGGALKEILKPLFWGLGAYFADGQAWYSWIHRDDLCRQIIWAIESGHVSGTYNAVAPNPVRNKTLVALTANAMRPWALLLPVPAFVLRLMLGEMADTILFSNKVSADRAAQAGFTFLYPELGQALQAIFERR